MAQTHPTPGFSRLRVLIVDAHEVYRAAGAALLRTEGLDAVELAPDGDVIGVARTFGPNVVLIDAGTPAARLSQIARALQSSPVPPAVVVISTAAPDRLDPGLAELPFLAKADVCAEEILRARTRFADESASPPQSG